MVMLGGSSGRGAAFLYVVNGLLYHNHLIKTYYTNGLL